MSVKKTEILVYFQKDNLV